MSISREQRVQQALFLGDRLTMENPAYCHAVGVLTDMLLKADLAPCDLTVKALCLESDGASAYIMSRENGVIAGLAEFAWMVRRFGVEVALQKRDGDVIGRDEIVVRMKGERSKLLSMERVGLNLLQRMSGIATETRLLQGHGQIYSPSLRIVATRKTPWGLVDKRAVHLGGGGTHRLGLGDAILIKNNHLALIAASEVDAVPVAIQRAWKFNTEANFIEVEVRSEAAATTAAQTFQLLQEQSHADTPCLILLDNMEPFEITRTLDELKRKNLWDAALYEASGGIADTNFEGYAASGVDVISIGALTHSPRAIDLSQRIS